MAKNTEAKRTTARLKTNIKTRVGWKKNVSDCPFYTVFQISKGFDLQPLTAAPEKSLFYQKLPSSKETTSEKLPKS
ncbi:TPA: hypothetical protein NJ077_004462 [Vibrio parahaemolyticus]|uniref:hypothetical protein n=1 Tax=Vibrio parahaemolyticus TaxID=670 RepID=UPI0015DD8A87|nr:hypothetical protein [Vibrio parahaemolyticus]HCG6122953.1 hypothetical protein [Vibrio parahaemolyticus]HCG6989229.1 hypothetical protein [Vibrio parahaemolyticus]